MQSQNDRSWLIKFKYGYVKQILLDQGALDAIANALSDKISDKIETKVDIAMQATIKKIVDGFVSGLKSQVDGLEKENLALKKANKNLLDGVNQLEMQHSKRNCLRVSGLDEQKTTWLWLYAKLLTQD